jgi:hypothetical protein
MLVENKKGDKFGNLIFEVSKDDKLATRAAALEGIFWHNNGALSEDIRQLSGGSEGAGVRLNDLVSSLRSINKKNIIDDFMGHRVRLYDLYLFSVSRRLSERGNSGISANN